MINTDTGKYLEYILHKYTHLKHMSVVTVFLTTMILKLLMVWALLLSTIHGYTLYPEELTVEYLQEPLAVDSPNPRLAWILKPYNTINFKLSQTAYQIIVASSAELLESEKPDLWDSEKVNSDNTINVRYQGKILEPGQRVFWTVRVWDQVDDVSAYANVSID